jgi:hypothetical protein
VTVFVEVVVGEDVLEHATDVNNKAVASARPITNGVIFLVFIFMFYSFLEDKSGVQ